MQLCGGVNKFPSRKCNCYDVISQRDLKEVCVWGGGWGYFWVKNRICRGYRMDELTKI